MPFLDLLREYAPYVRHIRRLYNELNSIEFPNVTEISINGALDDEHVRFEMLPKLKQVMLHGDDLQEVVQTNFNGLVRRDIKISLYEDDWEEVHDLLKLLKANQEQLDVTKEGQNIVL